MFVMDMFPSNGLAHRCLFLFIKELGNDDYTFGVLHPLQGVCVCCSLLALFNLLSMSLKAFASSESVKPQITLSGAQFPQKPLSKRFKI